MRWDVLKWNGLTKGLWRRGATIFTLIQCQCQLNAGFGLMEKVSEITDFSEGFSSSWPLEQSCILSTLHYGNGKE